MPEGGAVLLSLSDGNNDSSICLESISGPTQDKGTSLWHLPHFQQNESLTAEPCADFDQL